jgi:hypothetical protein
MICRECGTDVYEVRNLLCVDCHFNHERKVEERALVALERIRDALEVLAGSADLAWYPVKARKP